MIQIMAIDTVKIRVMVSICDRQTVAANVPNIETKGTLC